MRLDLSDDQALLRETTARFVEAELPLSATRSWHEDPVGYDPGWLRKGAALGWFAMLVDEEHGGGSVSGDGLVDATVVAEELGRHVQPGPFVPMNVVADAVNAHGTPAQRADLLPGIVAGELVATWAFADERGNIDDGAGVVAERVPQGLRLVGARGFVQDARSADRLLVTATLDGEPVQVLVPARAPGITTHPLSSLDLSRRMAGVVLDGVVVGADALLGGAGAGAGALRRQLDRAIVLNCAETVGAMDVLLSMTVAYSKDRIAFGRPIGSFQALKHVMADQALFLESAKAAASAAADAVQAGGEGASEAASMAAAYIADAGNALAQECLQIHGGIGYTWEHDLHLLLRRVRSNSALYGEASWHRERLCRLHGLGGAA